MNDCRMLSAWDNEAVNLVLIRRSQAEVPRQSYRSGRLICIEGCSAPAFTNRRLYTNLRGNGSSRASVISWRLTRRSTRSSRRGTRKATGSACALSPLWGRNAGNVYRNES